MLQANEKAARDLSERPSSFLVIAGEPKCPRQQFADDAAVSGKQSVHSANSSTIDFITGRVAQRIV